MGSSTTSGKLCAATTKAGRPCQAHAVSGSEYCFAHAPELAQERKEARSRGGRSRHNRSLDSTVNDPLEIHDLADVVRVLAEEVNILRSLEVSISRGRAIGYLCGVLVTAYGQSELELRLDAVERILKEREHG